MVRTFSIFLFALVVVAIATYSLQVAIDANYRHLNRVVIQAQLNNS